jgi:uncharacterized protein YutD
VAIKKIIFKREELYARIWTVPIVRLSKEFGISDVALAKICKKLIIPRPPRGYWAKLEFKKNVKRPPLPDISPDVPSEYVHFDYPKPEYEVNVDSAIRKSISVKRDIVVLSNLDNPHHLVKAAKTILEHTKPYENGLLFEHRRSCLDVKVSPLFLERALRIMDAVVKGFEVEGVAISFEPGFKDSSYATIKGEKIFFSLVEDYRRVDHIPTKEEKTRPSWDMKRYDYHPTGKMSLNISVNGAYGTRKIWSDSKTGRLEEKVGDFLNGAILIAHVLKMERQKWEEKQQKLKEEQRQREENEKKLAEEKARLQELELQAELWAKSEKIRRFALAVETAVACGNLPEEQKKGIVSWMAWARKQADQMDPIKLTFPD